MSIIIPVLWTIISLFAVFIGFNSSGKMWYIGLFIFAAVACAVAQWLVYFKKNQKKR